MTAAAKDGVAPSVRPGCQRKDATAGCSTRSHRARLSSSAAIGRDPDSLPVAQPGAETDLLGDLACSPGCGVPRDTSREMGSKSDGI